MTAGGEKPNKKQPTLAEKQQYLADTKVALADTGISLSDKAYAEMESALDSNELSFAVLKKFREDAQSFEFFKTRFFWQSG